MDVPFFKYLGFLLPVVTPVLHTWYFIQLLLLSYFLTLINQIHLVKTWAQSTKKKFYWYLFSWLREPVHLSIFIKIIATVSSRFYMTAPKVTHSVTLPLAISDFSEWYRESLTNGLVKSVLWELRINGYLFLYLKRIWNDSDRHSVLEHKKIRSLRV